MRQQQMSVLRLRLGVYSLQIRMIRIHATNIESSRLITHFIGAITTFHLHIECTGLVFVTEQIIHLVMICGLGKDLAVLATLRLIANIGR